MNRKYALPAAIALAAHASIFFVGSGKPPSPPPVDRAPAIQTPSSLLEDAIFLQAVESIKEELKNVANSDDSGGGEKRNEVLAPPGIPDVPRTDDSGARPRQDYKPVDIGKGDKIPTSLRSFGDDGDGSGKGPRVFTPTMLDEPPCTRHQKAPIYPSALRSSGTSGTVWVEFLVDENGRVQNAKAIESTHHGFDEATIAAVSEWRFVPGKHKGLPVRFRMSLPVVFSLSD